MRVRPFFLDLTNTATIEGMSVADRVRVAGKEHFWSKREGGAIDTVVIHYASARAVDPGRAYDMRLVVKIFCDLGVSSHYIITRGGDVYLLVPEDMKAWHCGGSIMPAPDNRRGVNDFSIGIELIGTDESGFTKKQYASLARLCRDLEKRRQKKFVYVGHEDIAGRRAVRLGLRKDRKVDPGAAFDWNLLRSSLRSPPPSGKAGKRDQAALLRQPQLDRETRSRTGLPASKERPDPSSRLSMA
jgi:N-acetyl-anhydromuramyl-L-alanine amidase AmpD